MDHTLLSLSAEGHPFSLPQSVGGVARVVAQAQSVEAVVRQAKVGVPATLYYYRLAQK